MRDRRGEVGPPLVLLKAAEVCMAKTPVPLANRLGDYKPIRLLKSVIFNFPRASAC